MPKVRRARRPATPAARRTPHQRRPSSSTSTSRST